MHHIDSQLKTLVTGRRVAIVGPADYVNKELSEEHGSYIDSHDIVVRLNRLNVSEENKKYYGSKTTIVASSFWTRLKPEFPDPKGAWSYAAYCQEEEYKKLNEKTILLECYARNEFQAIYSKFKNTLDSKKLYYGNISPEMNKKVYDFCRQNNIIINKTLSTGLMTLIIFILLEPKKIYITGFTGHSDFKHKSHFEGAWMVKNYKDYVPEGYKDDYKPIDVENSTVDHPFDEEAIIIALCVKNKLVKPDKYLKKLMLKLNLKRPIIHTFGDSHSSKEHGGWGYCNVIDHHIGPKLCYSFGTMLLDRLDIRKFNVNDGDSIIFCFGEIDCRCHVHKCITKEKTYKDIIDELVENYMKAINLNLEVSDIKIDKIGVYNVIPPVRRYRTAENPKFPYLGTDDERKQYILYFNEKLKEKCNENNFIFFDIYNKYCDNEGFLNLKFSDRNVHINNGTYINEFLINNFY